MTPEPNRQKSPEEIRREIEATRADMSETINGIQERFGDIQQRLSPSYYTSQLRERFTSWKDSAMRAIRDTTGTTTRKTADLTETAVRALRDTTGKTVRKVDTMTHNASERVGEVGGGIVNTIRENPVSFALIGAGLGLLAAGSTRAAREMGRPHYRTSYQRGDTYASAMTTEGASSGGMNRDQDGEGMGSKMRERASHLGEETKHLTERTRESASHMMEGTRHYAERTRDRASHMLEDNPMAAGVIAMLAGAAIGLMIPNTRYENRLMGDARDQLMDRARGVAQDAMDVAKEAKGVGQEALESAKDVAKDAMNVAKDTKSVGQEAKEVGQEAKDAAKNVAQDVKNVVQDAKNIGKDANKGGQDSSKKDSEKRTQS